MSRTAIFQKIPLLSDLPKAERDYLVSVLSVIRVEPGEVLFREGEPGESLFAILEGRLEVLLGMGTPDEKVIASLGPGDFLGEMSLLIPGRMRTASARAAELSLLWKMTRADFDALMVRQPRLAYTMVQTLTKRLDSTNTAAFRDLQEKNRQLQQAYDELKAAQAQIIEKERLERELQLAAEIQISILPQQLPSPQGYTFGAHMQPARMVGGDFYDIFTLADDRLGVVVGDVADKGIPSAIFMARTHALVMAEALHGGSPGDILRRVNAHLIQLQQSSLFVTILLGILDLETGSFHYARAGHELPLLLTSAGKVQTLPKTPGQPVGLFDVPLMDEQSLLLPRGGTLILFSDGLTDCRNPNGESFGHERLSTLLGGLKDSAGQLLCNALVEALAAYQSNAMQEDDITIIAVSRLENRQSPD
jgi:serine phosphatase RsbU (regulator of sigma subunit)